MDKRDVGPDRNVPAKRLIDLRLARRVGQMIVAADDMGHAHVVIIDHDRQHIGRVAVGAQQHEIIELLVGEYDLALHLVVDDGLALLPGAQSDDGGDAGRGLGRVPVAPAAVIAHRAPFRSRLLAHLLELLGAGVAAIGGATREHFVHGLAVAPGATELAYRLAIPVETEPVEAVENGVDRQLGRALAVGILDAQKEGSAEAFRVEPVEQRCARAADMQEAGRGGGEAGDDLGHRAKARTGGIEIERVALADEGRRGKAAPCASMPHSLRRPRDARLSSGRSHAAGREWTSSSC